MKLASGDRGQQLTRFGRTFFRKGGSRTDVRAEADSTETKTDEPPPINMGNPSTSQSGNGMTTQQASSLTSQDDAGANAGSITLISLLAKVDPSSLKESATD